MVTVIVHSNFTLAILLCSWKKIPYEIHSILGGNACGKTAL